MSTNRNLILGLFFVVVIAILAYFTLFMTDFNLFGEKTRMQARFTQTNGLREGDPVLVAGMRWGKVESLVFDPTATQKDRITVTFTLDEPITLHDDSSIMIEDATLLGGKNLSIEPGTAGRPTITADGLYGTVSPNVVAALGELVENNMDVLTGALTGIDEIVASVNSGSGLIGELIYNEGLATSFTSAVADISTTFESTAKISSDLAEGKGSMGKLINDDAIYNQLENITTNLSALISDMRTGKGTVGRLLYDEEVADEVEAAVRNIRQITDDINSGEGTLGRLVGDGSLADDIEQITSRLANGEGTIGKLLKEDEVYGDLQRITENLAIASEALSAGEGTLGRLVMDDELYRELQRAMTTLTGTLEEAREAAPISTFLNTVFLGF